MAMFSTSDSASNPLTVAPEPLPANSATVRRPPSEPPASVSDVLTIRGAHAVPFNGVPRIGHRHRGRSTMTALTEQLAALASMSPAQLRAEWRRVYRSPAPRLTPDLLMRGIAYRLQERALGKLPVATVSLFEKAARRLSQDQDIDQPKRQSLKPGTRLVRSWSGKTYSVLVTDEGFELGVDGWTGAARL